MICILNCFSWRNPLIGNTTQKNGANINVIFESNVVVILIFACRVEIPFNWKTYFSTLFDVINIFVTFALLVVGTLITRIPCIFRAENETNLLPTMSLSKVTFEYRPSNQICIKKARKNFVKSITWKTFIRTELPNF